MARRAFEPHADHSVVTYGAGTIIGVQYTTRSPPRGAVNRCPYRSKTRAVSGLFRPRDMSPTARILGPPAVPIAGRTMKVIPPLCAHVRSALSTAGVVGLLTARCLRSPSQSQRSPLSGEYDLRTDWRSQPNVRSVKQSTPLNRADR